MCHSQPLLLLLLLLLMLHHMLFTMHYIFQTMMQICVEYISGDSDVSGGKQCCQQGSATSDERYLTYSDRSVTPVA